MDLEMIIQRKMNIGCFHLFVESNLENSERDGHTRPPDLTLEKPIYRKQQLELDMKQQTDSK